MSLFCRLSEQAKEFCISNKILPLFESGVAVALSGGADSVFLLRFVHGLSLEKSFPLCAFHVNHGLRGAESDQDEAFCRLLCRELSIPFFAAHVSVFESKEKLGGTIEEAARRERYRAFSEFLDAHPEYAYILTAHTASDNLETVLFRLARGSGLRGLCGIPIQRERFLRPLLSLNGTEIRNALDEISYSCVFDSSNRDVSYRRNYIRNKVVPSFLKIHEDAENNVTRVCRNLSLDEDFLSKETLLFIQNFSKGGIVVRDALKNLHEAIFVRAVNELYRQAGGFSGCEGVHLKAAYALVASNKTSGRIDFPDGLSFLVSKTEAFFEKTKPQREDENGSFAQTELSLGENLFPAYGFGIALKREKDDRYFQMLKSTYSQVFFADLSSAYDGKALYLRERKDGDSYRYGGMTHKIKKLFSDRKLSLDERKKRLLLCDEEGILWVPGFSPREPREKKTEEIYAYFFMNGGKDE